MATVTRIVDQALGPVCSIILITGAGGTFGGVLKLSGIGDAPSGSPADPGISGVLKASTIESLVQRATGSATVAATPTGGRIDSAVADAHLSDFKLALIVVVNAAGATVLSHVNDSGFWLVSRLFGMDEKTTLKTWTVMETTLGLAVFAIAYLLWLVT